MSNLSLQLIPESNRFLEISLLLVGITAGLRTLTVTYMIFSQWYYIPQPNDLLSIHRKVDEMTVGLRNYLTENSQYILPDTLNDLDTQLRYDQLIKVYDTLKITLSNFEFVRDRLGIIREHIVPGYIDQYTAQLNTVSESCVSIVAALRHLEGYIILNNPHFVILVQQASETI